MVLVDESAFICDMAETYHIFDYKALPVDLLATLASGLRENSRIRCKMAHLPISWNTFLQAAIYDKLSILWWAQTEDAKHNENRPDSIVALLLGKNEDEKKIESFASGEDFMARWRALGGK